MKQSVLDRLEILDQRNQSMDPDPDTLQEWMDALAGYAQQFKAQIPTAKGYETNLSPTSSIQTSLLKDTPTPLPEILADYRKSVMEVGLNAASGKHLGYIPGGGLIPGAIGDFVAAMSNVYAGIYFASPGAVRIENTLLEWMRDLFHLHTGTAGTLTSGGSIANLIAVVCARDARKVCSTEFQKLVIYTSSQTHHCIDKAIRIAGLGDSEQRTVPLDESYRIQPAAFAAVIREDREAGRIPFMLVASAGTTDTGAVDPLPELAATCKAENVWFHIDAAYGGFFQLTEHGRSKLKGIEWADSLVVDPHKGLFLPYGLGAVLVRDGEQLRASNHFTANYMQDANRNPSEWSPAELSPELTRHFRGLRMWFSLRAFGLDKFREGLEHKLLLALYAHNQLSQLDGIKTGPPPDLSVVLYRFTGTADDNAFNLRVTQEIQEGGEVFISSTTIDGTVWLRFAILSFRSDKQVIDTALEILKRYLA